MFYLKCLITHHPIFQKELQKGLHSFSHSQTRIHFIEGSREAENYADILSFKKNIFVLVLDKLNVEILE